MYAPGEAPSSSGYSAAAADPSAVPAVAVESATGLRTLTITRASGTLIQNIAGYLMKKRVPYLGDVILSSVVDERGAPAY